MINVRTKILIPEFNLNIYFIMIIIAYAASILYIITQTVKEFDNKSKLLNIIVLYSFILVYIFTSIICGVMGNILIYGNNDIGLSSYGCGAGALLSSVLFEIIGKQKIHFLKYTIMSMPLTYGLAKIGCFLAGCCFGIPYKGLFSVIYKRGLNISVFPIQLLETIVFITIFLIFNILKIKNNNKIYKMIIICAISKFALDFLRYNHINSFITINQVISIAVFIAAYYLYIRTNNKLKVK